MRWVFKLFGLTRIHSGWYLKNRYFWVGSLIYPFSFFVVLGIVGGIKTASHAIVGALITHIWMSGVGFMPQFLFSYKFVRLKDMFVAAPIHPLTYMLGAALSVLVASLRPTTALLIILAVHIQIIPINMFYLLFTLLVTWLVSSALGFVIAGYVKDPTRIGTIAPYTGAILTVLPPVYYPLEYIAASNYLVVALLAPTTHLAQMAKVAIGISSPIFNPLFHVFAILVYLIIFILLASFKSRWREK